jgi:hypothetical protein
MNEATIPPAHSSWQREATIAAAALGFGLLVLPFAVYLVGIQLLGEYENGPMALAETIWLDLVSLRLSAWILVLSPYVTLLLVRWVRRVWRTPKSL